MENEMIEMEPSGRVLPLFRGDYLDNVIYENPDIVLFNNSSYVAKKTTIGNPPPTDALSDDNWQMVAKGIIDADVSTSIVRFSENESESMENIESGETVKVAFGKLRKALALLFGHYAEKATASILGHVKLSNSAAITKQGEFALDAIEKNATIEGTLAHLIASQNSDLTNSINQLNSKLANASQIISESTTLTVGQTIIPAIDVRKYRYFIVAINWMYTPVTMKRYYSSTHDIIETSLTVCDSEIGVLRQVEFLINRSTGEINLKKWNQINLQSNSTWFIPNASGEGVGLYGLF